MKLLADIWIFIYFCCIKLANWILRTFTNWTITVILLFLILILVMFLYNDLTILSFLLIAIPGIIACGIYLAGIKRINNYIILNRFSARLSMNILNPLLISDYCQQKELIAKILKAGFVDALEKSAQLQKQIKFATHPWLIKNVVSDPRVQGIYHIQIKPLSNPHFLRKEIIGLLSLSVFWEQRHEIFAVKRPLLEVFLTVKK